MNQRKITEKNRAWLWEEMKIWKDNGIISDDHAAGIQGLYVDVQEGKGHDYEDAVRYRKLSAKISVTADGQAVLCDLVVGQ
jgi:uncharacterized membrane-anchored protein